VIQLTWVSREGECYGCVGFHVKVIQRAYIDSDMTFRLAIDIQARNIGHRGFSSWQSMRL
jgi:hypothetical protein